MKPPYQDFLNLHHVEFASRANGPGLRSVIWFQGCTLGCPGCFNPLTHEIHAGEQVTISQLVAKIRSSKEEIEGVTISGGEPFQQVNALSGLVSSIKRETHLSIVLFSGFDWVEIDRMPKSGEILPNLDVLIAGRYIASQRVANHLKGSANKTFHFLTNRYSPSDFDPIPTTEIVIEKNGILQLSGIDPLQWNLNEI